MRHPDQLQRIPFVIRVPVVEEERMNRLLVLRIQIVNVQHVPVVLLTSIRYQRAQPHRIDSVQHVKRAVQEHIQVVDV